MKIVVLELEETMQSKLWEKILSRKVWGRGGGIIRGGCSHSMDSARLPTDTRNIPHMQLFYQLKQKFPDLKDSDVNESIQKVNSILVFCFSLK